jgi:hypothetical protein
MKSLSFACCFLAASLGAFAQGNVTIINGTYSLVLTNSTAIGGSVGNTSPTIGGFYYGLFTAPLGTTNTDLTSGLWTFTGVYATNTTITTGGKLSGGTEVASTAGWPPATVSNTFLIAGWSANLAQTNWTSISNQLAGARPSGGQWSGGNWIGNGFFGVSSTGYGVCGGGPQSVPAPNLFGRTPTFYGIPITNGWSLYPVTARLVVHVAWTMSGPQLTWTAVPFTQSYSVLAAPTLDGSFSPIVIGLTFGDANGNYTDTSASGSQTYYRLTSP